MQIESYVNADKVKQLQDLVKQFNLRWLFNPYPATANNPYGKWRVGIDYSDVSNEQAKQFDLAWQRLETPIVEIIKSYSTSHKLKVWAKRIFLRK